MEELRNKAAGWQWAYQRLRDGRLTIEEVDLLIFNEDYPIGKPGWRDGMVEAIWSYKEDIEDEANAGVDD